MPQTLPSSPACSLCGSAFHLAPYCSVVEEMRSWCADTFSDMPEDADDAEIVACVRAQYDGGLAAFVADCGIR